MYGSFKKVFGLFGRRKPLQANDEAIEFTTGANGRAGNTSIEEDRFAASLESLRQEVLRGAGIQNLVRSLEDRLAASLDNLRKELSELADRQNPIESSQDRLTESLDSFRELLSLIPGLNNSVESLDEKLSEQLGSLSQQVSATGELVSEHLPVYVRGSALTGFSPEIALMRHLRPFLSTGTAIDVGAHCGKISGQLLDSGYEVYAFEPCSEVFEQLRRNLSRRNNCYLFQFAIGPANTTMDLHIAEDNTPEHIYGDRSLFNSLVRHSMPPKLEFASAIPVPVRSLASLAREGRIPDQLGLVTIDSGGFELEALRGMGDLRPEVVASEFWSAEFVFARSSAFNRLDELAEHMHDRGYNWFIVIYRLPETDRVSFYCNYDGAVTGSRGQVFFFRGHEVFLRALEWCTAVLPQTYMAAENQVSGFYLAHGVPVRADVSAKIAKLEKLVATYQSDAERHQELLSVRDEALAARDHVLALQDQELSDRTRELATRTQELAARDRELTARHRELAALDNLLAERASDIAALDKLLAQRDSDIAALLAQRDGDIAGYRAKIEQLTAQTKGTEDRLRSTERRIDKMRRSLSWKVTAPLREIRRAGEALYRLVI